MKRMLMHNIRLKAFSLGIAIILYLFIAYESDTSVEVELPVKIITDSDITVVSDVPDYIQVTYRGPWAFFRNYDLENAEPLVLELKDQAPGPLAISIRPDLLPRMPGMKAVRINPSMLNLQLDRVIERFVTVRGEVRGSPAQGYALAEVIVYPKRVLITGPALSVEKISYVLTKPIDITGATSTVKSKVALRAPSYPVQLKDEELEIELTAVIEEEYIERFVKNIPVVLEKQHRHLRLKTSTISFSIKGPVLALDELTPEKLKAVVSVPDESKMTVGVFEVYPEIEGLPERVYLFGSNPMVSLEYKPRRARRRRRK